ncbi:MAG: AraC family transcriptional regulator [Siphonobacter aquaeclarae]|jgi:AraC-like DNA-binding protein|nr:AraC family transcriptional regulator [Siphonobacter aquaeclarae]
MKPELLKIPTGPAHSFTVHRTDRPNINNRWHYHPEFELIHFHRGRGMQFIGDSIQRFSAGDVILVGANLPHYWHFDEELPAGMPYSTVIHFRADFWGDAFLSLPENIRLRQLMETAGRGLLLTRDTGERVAQWMEATHEAEGPARLIGLLQCLTTIIAAPEQERAELASPGFTATVSPVEEVRMNLIYAHIFRHFQDKIPLEEIASVAGMVPNSFCRYFRSRTGKTYTRFLIEVRVGYACKLLIEKNLSIKEVGYESGFHNFSCFHKYFRLVTGRSPLIYQREYARQCD